MQSTGQTSMQASQPVQLSARTTANSFGSFFRALPAPFAMNLSPSAGRRVGPGAFPRVGFAAFGRAARRALTALLLPLVFYSVPADKPAPAAAFRRQRTGTGSVVAARAGPARKFRPSSHSSTGP